MVNSENARVTLAICRSVRSDTAQNIPASTENKLNECHHYNVPTVQFLFDCLHQPRQVRQVYAQLSE